MTREELLALDSGDGDSNIRRDGSAEALHSEVELQDMEEPTHALVHELSLRDSHIRSLVGLELPVYAADDKLDKMLETVGGLANFQQTHESKSQFLPVKLRPTEPSCKPFFADLTKTQTILLKVKRKKRRREQQGQSAAEDNGNDYQVDAEIVGLVKETYVCEGMADFQYFTAKQFYPTDIAQERAVAVGQTSICKPSTTQLEIKASLRPFLRVQQEQELEMIPEVFSKVDLPLKYEFRQRSGYQPTERAKKPSNTMTYLNFHDDVPAPAEPKPEHPVVRRRPVGANEGVDDHVLKLLQAKLEEKPIWLRPKLFVGLDFLERRAARRILRKLCYVFVDGPWRGSWIRMGYDPRKTVDSARYQVIELRNNRELVHAKVTHPSRKRTKKYSGINPKGPRIVKVTQTSEQENAQAMKRRRKERFSRGETRRSYLVDPNEKVVISSPPEANGGSGSAGAGENNQTTMNDWHSDSDQEQADDTMETVSVTSSTVKVDDGSRVNQATTSISSGEKMYEIFGVPLTSANVLFQLEEIDDEEVKAWTSQFAVQSEPSLLGGWYPTQMFLPLREMVRYRIAALVGRSKAELESRRKHIDALKKQALIDYAEQMGKAEKQRVPGETEQQDGGDNGGKHPSGDAAQDEEVDDELALERALVQEHAKKQQQSRKSDPILEVLQNVDGQDGSEEVEREDGEDMDLDEDDEDDAQQRSAGKLRASHGVADEDDDDGDDEEEDDDDAAVSVETITRMEEVIQSNATSISTRDAISTETEYTF